MANVNKREWTTPKGQKKEAWQVRYKDDRGRYRARSFARKKEADAFCHKVTVEVQQGIHLARSETVTVSELIDAYLENCDQRHKDGRKMSYAHITTLHRQFKNHVRPVLGNHKVADLDFLTVERWANSLLRKNRLSPLSVRNLLYMLRVAVDFGIRRGWVKTNIVRDVMVEFRGMKHEPIRTFARADVARLIAALNQRSPGKTVRNHLLTRSFCHLALFCGLRWGEIAALKIEHVRFDERIIEVRHSLQRNDELKGPKSKAGIRNVPMPAIVAEGLKTWLRDHYVPNDRGLIFRLPDDRQIQPAMFHTCHWQPLLKRAELDIDTKGRRFHFHALRHFCASMMIQQGVPLTDVAELLGHSSYDMTLQVYVYATPWLKISFELLQDSAFNLEAFIGAKLGERLGRIANQRLTIGTGSSQPNGIVTAASIGKTAAAAAAIAADELIDLQHSVNAAYRRSPRCGWMFADTTLASIRKLKDGQGNFLWQMGDVRVGAPDLILGKQYFVNDDVAAMAANARTVVFGDMGAYIVRKVGSPLIGTVRERFWPKVGMAGLVRFDGELTDTAAVKVLRQAAS